MEGTVLPLEDCRGIGFNVFMTPCLRGLRSPRGQGRGHCRRRGPHFRRCPPVWSWGLGMACPFPHCPKGSGRRKGPMGGERRILASWGRQRLGGPGPPWSRGRGKETCTFVLPILRCPQAWGGPGTESRLAPTGPSDLPSSVQLPSAQHFACRGTCCWARRSFLNSGKVRKKGWSLMDVPHTQVLTNWIPL